MFCSLSGQPAQHPVVSPRSHKVFEKHLILSYLSTNQKDPITDEPLSAEELVDVVVDGAVVPPKPPAHTSIPALLASFQNEFDAMALEVFSLRKQLNVCKQELSSALYYGDAAAAVAAAAVRERDEARGALEELALGPAMALALALATLGPQDGENGSMPGPPDLETVELISSTASSLFSHHKSHKIPAPTSISLHLLPPSPTKKHTASHYDPFYNSLVVNHGKEIVVTDLASKTTSKISHRGNLTCLNLIEFNQLVTPIYGTKDQVRVGAVTMSYDQAVVDIQTHPKLKRFYVVCTARSWTLCRDDAKLMTVPVEGSITTAQFHIDGEILAVGTAQGTAQGTDLAEGRGQGTGTGLGPGLGPGQVQGTGQVQIFNITTGALASTLPTKTPPTKLEFGLNGYWLASLSGDQVEIFDLRKSVVVSTVEEVQDFGLDGSCTVMVAARGGRLEVMRYNKKEKTWRGVEAHETGVVEKVFLTGLGGILLAVDKTIPFELETSLA